jgi:hypothetical protein
MPTVIRSSAAATGPGLSGRAGWQGAESAVAAALHHQLRCRGRCVVSCNAIYGSNPATEEGRVHSAVQGGTAQRETAVNRAAWHSTARMAQQGQHRSCVATGRVTHCDTVDLAAVKEG